MTRPRDLTRPVRCAYPGCPDKFTRAHGSQKYCPKHQNRQVRTRSANRAATRAGRLAANREARRRAARWEQPWWQHLLDSLCWHGVKLRDLRRGGTSAGTSGALSGPVCTGACTGQKRQIRGRAPAVRHPDRRGGRLMTATPPHDPGNEPGEPLRWERDSRKEDFEAHRHRMMDRLDAWAAEQSRAPLTNVLEGAGVERRPGETWASYIVPKGWADVTPPEPRCPWCQRPADSDATCQDCTDARDGDPDPAGITAWWQDAAPITRRLYLNAAHGTDPWTGKPCRIRYQSVTAGEEGVQVTHTWRPLVPRSSWDLRPAP